MILNIKYLNFTQVFWLLFLIIALDSCVVDTSFPINKKVVCNMEMLNEKGDMFIAANDSSKFFVGGSLRTDLVAHSGKYSVLTTPITKPYALKHKIRCVDPDSYINVSVWRKSNDEKGVLVVTGKNKGELYFVTKKVVETHENDWDKLEIDVYTPPDYKGDTLMIYVWNNSTDTVYFDDLIIERQTHKQYPDYNYDEGLNLVFDTSDFVKIMEKRKKAFENGILQASDNDWVKGIVVDNDEAMKAKMRLKGDWLDHLWGDKWSYRVKMKKDNAFNRLRIFSLQTPSARSYLLEWVTHKLFHENDVLTTRYGFIPLKFNNQPRGLYVWEEHFVKQLLEWNNRREGPIVKFSEDPFWQIQKMNINFKKWPVFPYYPAATIIPFGQKKTVENDVLFKQYLSAQKLMNQYKYQQKKTHEIFDVDKLAKYYAMLELTHARHGMVWHNQRMYYNPVICKLEPIAFDGYTDHDEPDLSINDNMAFKAFTHKEPMILQEHLILNLFADTVFLSKYLYYLEEYSKPESIDEFLSHYESEIKYNDSILQLEFPFYRYDNELLIKSAEVIREYLPDLKQIIIDSLSDGNFGFQVKYEVYNDTSVYENTPEFFVNVYIEDISKDSLKLDIQNYFTRDLVFLGTGIDNSTISNYFIDKLTLNAFNGDIEQSKLIIDADTSANYLFFMVNDKMDTYTVPILPWPFPKGITPQQELMAKVDLNNELFDTIIDNNIYIKEGNITVREPIIISDGFYVNFSAGTSINLVDSAMIISYSPVFMKGTATDPIVITSSDYTGNGFTVLQAKEISILENVVFENLNTLDYNSWTLTGAVTFYESDVSIANTKFYRNQCEDALNIIRSDFVLSNSSFHYIYGDAFDADYCTGEILHSNFTNIGNDAMDFSGSEITIKDTEVNLAEDKGISGGEDSKVTVFNTTIQRANIGLASKDLSVVEVIDSRVETCNYGLVLLQKKPEYGPSVMILKNTKLRDLKVEMLIEENSKVEIYGRTIFGKEKNLSDIFY